LIVSGGFESEEDVEARNISNGHDVNKLRLRTVHTEHVSEPQVVAGTMAMIRGSAVETKTPISDSRRFALNSQKGVCFEMDHQVIRVAFTERQ
jgi:hypothetical protein